jgi:hypothetical protein
MAPRPHGGRSAPLHFLELGIISLGVLQGSPSRLDRHDASDGKYLDEFTELVADTGGRRTHIRTAHCQSGSSEAAPDVRHTAIVICPTRRCLNSDFMTREVLAGAGCGRNTLESCGYVLRPMELDGAAEVSAVSLTLKGVVCHDRQEVPLNWPTAFVPTNNSFGPWAER